ESDPFAVPQCVSDDSPIGRALIGARKGDTVNIETPKGIYRCTVVSISK
ncbi:MAG: GreA/GreB family elongation factor, partial [Clostridia bacterium]|nr:GreA/GreB family elongation factor [Clostridia bacterium]